MQPERKRPAEMGALGALLGLIAGLIIRWFTDGGIVTVLLCGLIGIGIGVAVSMASRKM